MSVETPICCKRDCDRTATFEYCNDQPTSFSGLSTGRRCEYGR